MIFYADITSLEFSQLNTKAKEFAQKFDLTYALRHLDLREPGKDYIGGFGAELIMKNMEYNPTEDVNLNYVPLEKWPTEGISRKALTYLLSFKSLSELAQALKTLPDHIPSILSQEPDRLLSRELDRLAFSQVPVKNTLLINNQELQPDLFEALRILRPELRAVKQLEHLGIPAETASRLQTFCNLHLRSFQTKAKAIKTSLSTGRLYLNDLEVDNKYSDLPQSPEEFLLSYGNEMSPVALNFMNVVLVCDVTSAYCFQTMSNIIELVDLVPFHLAFIFTGSLPRATLLMEGLRQLKKAEEDLPFEFLELVRFEWTDEEIAQQLRELCPSCEFDFEYSGLGRRCLSFCENVGLCGPAQLVLNGRVLELDDTDLTSFEALKENLGYEFMREKRTVTALAMRGYLEPPLEAFFEKVKFMNTTERINLGISSVASAKIKVAGVPLEAEMGWSAKAPQGFVYVVLGPADLKLLKTALDFHERASDLNIDFKFVFDLDQVDEEWKEAASQIPNFDLENEQNRKNRENIKNGDLCGSCVVVNSRVISSALFSNYRDFYIALDTEASRLNVQELSKMVEPDRLESVIFTVLSSLKYSKPLQGHRAPPIPPALKQSQLTRVYNSLGLFDVQALVDIDSSDSGKLLSLCSYLHDLGGRVSLTLASLGNDQKFPIRTYYNYLIKSSFDSELSMTFNQSHTYSLNIDALDSWMVRPVKSNKDLDNLFIPDTESVAFAIKSLLVQGQCAQTLHGMHIEPPNGLQLTLKQSGVAFAETIVMKNFGYFQFQARPGSFEIELAQGRSSMIFDIALGGQIHVKDITGGSSLMSVSKKPGHEKEQVLELSRIDSGETIHVFSLASGKLYERLIKIMMTSVMKFTRSKVKFWLLEDFFSPNFSDGIDLLAKGLGFEYELLSYKWPSWLYRQTEKQRIIWGYKILFLDVLFPLSINRVIYIDADQVVRADIKELWDLDLKGAPYAYTPFCDSNPLTEKFMFWKGGYWKNHLKDLHYHISALYVVDLHTFRNLGAGDILRYFYETLAPSPDSLSNLDQDLPNFAQSHLKIYSLPQEWLWCASWCSEESQKNAKSIDLCNNPLTREHKIEAAKKYIPEWQDYDDYVTRLTKVSG